jgi:hypothetical protein
MVGDISRIRQPQNPRLLAHRLLWFTILWLGSVGTTAIVGFAWRLWTAPK